MRNWLRFDGNWVLALLLAAFALAPLTYPGFLAAWSGFAPVYVLHDLAAGRSLAFWGIGWPAGPAAIEGPLPYLLAGLLGRLGAAPAAAVRWVWALGFVLGALGTYGWLRRQGGAAALLGASAYTYLPYHLNATYARGAVGESLALGILPWLPWAVQWGGVRAVAGLGVGVLALLLTAPALAFLLAGPLALLLAWRGPGRARWAGWAMLLAGAVAGLWVWAWGPTGPSPVTLHRLLAGGEGLANPWALGLVPWAVFLGAVALVFTRRMPAREGWLWLAAFVLGCLVALVAPAPQGRAWSALALVALAVPPLVACLVEAWPALGRLEVAAGGVALMVLAVSPLLTPAFTRLDPGAEPLAVWQAEDGTRLALLTAEAQGEPTGAGGLQLDLRWQAWGPLTEDYTVFVHLVSAEGEMVAQEDAPPQGGGYPTSQWPAGEIVPDRYTLRAEAGTPGPFRVAMGWYRQPSGERLPVVRASRPAAPDHRVWVYGP